MTKNNTKKPNIEIIKKTVKESGGKIECIIPERDFFIISYKGKEIPFERKFVINSRSYSSARFTKNKDCTYRLLKRENIKTPKSIFFYTKSYDEKVVSKKLKKLKFPIFIKDLAGSNSLNIFPNVTNASDAEKIIKNEIKQGRNLLAQEMAFGKEYRILVLKNKIIGALEMIPPYVVGNGKDTIRVLIEKKQFKTKKKTPINKELEATLSTQGFSSKSVLDKGLKVYFKLHSSISEGGERKDVTSLVHKDFVKICTRAAEAAGKSLAGLDLICDDIEKPLKNQKYSILEINGKPDLYIHYKPEIGESRNVVLEILNFIVAGK